MWLCVVIQILKTRVRSYDRKCYNKREKSCVCNLWKCLEMNSISPTVGNLVTMFSDPWTSSWVNESFADFPIPCFMGYVYRDSHGIDSNIWSYIRFRRTHNSCKSYDAWCMSKNCGCYRTFVSQNLN